MCNLLKRLIFPSPSPSTQNSASALLSSCLPRTSSARPRITRKCSVSLVVPAFFAVSMTSILAALLATSFCAVSHFAALRPRFFAAKPERERHSSRSNTSTLKPCCSNVEGKVFWMLSFNQASFLQCVYCSNLSAEGLLSSSIARRISSFASSLMDKPRRRFSVLNISRRNSISTTSDLRYSEFFSPMTNSRAVRSRRSICIASPGTTWPLNNPKCLLKWPEVMDSALVITGL
ncbi:hypothetical protein D9M68_702840 [compost metagenome]